MVESQMRAGPDPQPIDNRPFVLIMQQTREKKEPLATAQSAAATLRHAALVVGLSWANLAGALGRSVKVKRWAVLYLGSARPAAFGLEQEIIALDDRGAPAADQQSALRDTEGVVLLDGSWSEAKTLWWRNPWLLRLRRLVLNPRRRSRFGRIRREPRGEALSTLEAAALVLKHFDGPEAEAALLAAFHRLMAEARPTHRRKSQRRVSA